MTPEAIALLHDVALVCIASIRYDAAQPRRRWVGRSAQIREIASDTRLLSRSTIAQRALIDDVMTRYDVQYYNARKMISAARKERNGNNNE